MKIQIFPAKQLRILQIFPKSVPSPHLFLDHLRFPKLSRFQKKSDTPVIAPYGIAQQKLNPAGFCESLEKTNKRANTNFLSIFSLKTVDDRQYIRHRLTQPVAVVSHHPHKSATSLLHLTKSTLLHA